jgi:hypothetical protein
MDTGFRGATAIERKAEGRYAVSIPDGWQQGRGAFGGLVLGALTRAMIDACDDTTRSVRVVSGDLCGPVLAGVAQIDVAILRRGNNQTNLDARLSQEGQVLARASATLAQERKADMACPAPVIPERPPWTSVSATPIAPPLAPVFTQHYEYRLLGAAPFSGATDPVASGFIREKTRVESIDAPALVALLDAWWPALIAMAREPRAIATVAYTAELACDPAELPPDEPLHYRAHVPVFHGGYFVEFRELWSGSRLVAMNQQTFALLR